jgi:protein O-GlcNAcase/histone acetyltransferase
MMDGPRVASGAPDAGFLSGVIEGFYGPPWSTSERFELFEIMAASGLNTYLYAPKDDLKHRVRWREAYSPEEAEALGTLIRACVRRGLRFIYALAPGLDIRFSRETDLDCLRTRVEQMLALGCRHFGLLFDDIPDQLDAEDAARWGSLASAHAGVTNALARWTRERQPGARFLFCPTPYCGRMADARVGGRGYLETVGRELAPDIDVCWTGPEIVSREITVDHVRGLQAILRRKPLIWDNLHANDYDGRRFYCGPYAGRPAELRSEVAGFLVNPNNEWPLNYVPIRTFGEFVRGRGPWDARAAYLAAMAGWLPRFRTAGRDMTLDDLVLLADCYYLPYEEGPAAVALLESARRLLASDPSGWSASAAELQQQAGRLRDVCAHLPELYDRPLFHALSRRTWELREEMDLLLGYLRSTLEHPDEPFRSGFHLPGTYRGGIVVQLQQLLAQRRDGTFVSASRQGPECPGPASRAAT